MMPTMNPAVRQWIGQMGDRDQVVAFFAYQSLQEEVFRAGGPGDPAEQNALAAVLGEALTALAKPGQAGREGASFRNNAFLMAAAQQSVQLYYPARVRTGLARLLGYLPVEAAVPYLERALGDLEVRETARQALENNPSERATDALVAALDAPGPEFCAGVVNSLARRKGEKVKSVLRKAATDQQAEVRTAAWLALADFPDPVHDAVLENVIRNAPAEERRVAHIGRVRLAETLRSAGSRSAAERIYRAVLAGDAPEPHKKAARLALQKL
jgi:hypothetical protein